MHSTSVFATDSCLFKPVENCNGKQVRKYLPGTPTELNLCRQCRTKYGVMFTAEAAADGADVENMFKEIMTRLVSLR